MGIGADSQTSDGIVENNSSSIDTHPIVSGFFWVELSTAIVRAVKDGNRQEFERALESFFLRNRNLDFTADKLKSTFEDLLDDASNIPTARWLTGYFRLRTAHLYRAKDPREELQVFIRRAVIRFGGFPFEKKIPALDVKDIIFREPSRP